MTVLRATRAHARMVAGLLEEFNAECETWSRRGRPEVHISVDEDEDDLDTRRFSESYGSVNRGPGSEERMLCYIQELP